MDRRLSPEIENTLARIILEYSFLDGVAIGGSVAKGSNGDDIDVDLLCFSREHITEQIRLYSEPEEPSYYLFKTTIEIRFAELSPDSDPLHIRMPIARTTVAEHGYRPTTIYVLRNPEIAKIWEIDIKKTEVYFTETS